MGGPVAAEITTSGLERLLRYCARPAFALERLSEIDAEHLVYESVKPGEGGNVSLMLTPLELIERLASPDSATAPESCYTSESSDACQRRYQPNPVTLLAHSI